MATYKKWTDAEIQFIKDNLGVLADNELSVKLSSMTSENISPAMVRRQRRKLGMNKPRGRPRKKSPIISTDSSN